jgi:hypothetical protein
MDISDIIYSGMSDQLLQSHGLLEPRKRKCTLSKRTIRSPYVSERAVLWAGTRVQVGQDLSACKQVYIMECIPVRRTIPYCSGIRRDTKNVDMINICVD